MVLVVLSVVLLVFLQAQEAAVECVWQLLTLLTERDLCPATFLKVSLRKGGTLSFLSRRSILWNRHDFPFIFHLNLPSVLFSGFRIAVT